MSPAAEQLLRDRFSEFQRLATAKGTLGATPQKGARTTQAGALLAGAGAAGGRGFMKEFFDDVGVVQNTLNEGKANVKSMGEVLEDALMATTQDREQEISNQLQGLVDETSGILKRAKVGLEALDAKSKEEENKKPNSAEGKIRVNMQRAMSKKHQKLLADFQQAQVEYKRALEHRQHEEMRILMPEASEEKRQEMMEEGQTATLLVAQKMAGAHAVLLEEVQRIRDKHQDILRLETSIADCLQMFNEMAVLVDAQGEMLDAIEVHVHKAAVCTEKAEKELVTTRKAQIKGQKWMCCGVVVLICVLLGIMGPVIMGK